MLMTDINWKVVFFLWHLKGDERSNKPLIKKHYLYNKLKQECGTLLTTALLRCISTLQQKEGMDSFKTKNYKLKRLIQTKTHMSNYKIPIINQIKRKQLQLGLEYSFVNEN